MRKSQEFSMTQKDKQRRNSLERSLQGYPLPDFEKVKKDHPEYDKEFERAINYANYEFIPSQLKEFAQECVGSDTSLWHIPDWEFFLVGQKCWIINNEGYIPLEGIKKIKDKIASLLKKYEKVVEEESNVKSIDPSIKNTTQIMAEFEGMLDDVGLGKETKTAEEIVADFGKFDKEKVKNHFIAVKTELEISLSDKNDEVKWSEDFLAHKDEYLEALDFIISSIDGGSDGKRGRRKGSKNKNVKRLHPSKMVEKFNYLAEYADLKITSISPEKIIGSQILWVFNTKTRFLGCFFAKDENGLQVKGSTILNFDEDKSIAKKVRKPEDIIPRLLNSGKVEQRKLLPEIRAKDKKLKGRVNWDCVLLKTF